MESMEDFQKEAYVRRCAAEYRHGSARQGRVCIIVLLRHVMVCHSPQETTEKVGNMGPGT